MEDGPTLLRRRAEEGRFCDSNLLRICSPRDMTRESSSGSAQCALPGLYCWKGVHVS